MGVNDDACRPDPYDPSPRELAAEIRAIRALMNERDTRYNERHEASQLAIATALTARQWAIGTAIAAAVAIAGIAGVLLLLPVRHP